MLVLGLQTKLQWAEDELRKEGRYEEGMKERSPVLKAIKGLEEQREEKLRELWEEFGKVWGGR